MLGFLSLNKFAMYQNGGPHGTVEEKAASEEIFIAAIEEKKLHQAKKKIMQGAKKKIMQ